MKAALFLCSHLSMLCWCQITGAELISQILMLSAKRIAKKNFDGIMKVQQEDL
jgi:hypothetical protein